MLYTTFVFRQHKYDRLIFVWRPLSHRLEGAGEWLKQCKGKKVEKNKMIFDNVKKIKILELGGDIWPTFSFHQ